MYSCHILTHWGRVTHICVGKLIIIGSDNGLSPERRQAIIWTNDGILLIRTLGKNFSEILSEIHSFSFKKMHLKMSSAKWRLFRLGLNELKYHELTHDHMFQDLFENLLSCMINTIAQLLMTWWCKEPGISSYGIDLAFLKYSIQYSLEPFSTN